MFFSVMSVSLVSSCGHDANAFRNSTQLRYIFATRGLLSREDVRLGAARPMNAHGRWR